MWVIAEQNKHVRIRSFPQTCGLRHRRQNAGNISIPGDSRLTTAFARLSSSLSQFLSRDRYCAASICQ
jgi:hypothetical protein